MSFTHYILTRFSIPHGMTDHQALYDPNYLSHRMLLFERITLPSVKNQTSQNFIWYIIIHETLPVEIRDRLQRHLENVENYKLHVVSGDKQWDVSVLDEIIRTEPQLNTHRLLSRLDDDDAMTIGTVASIQNKVLLSMDYQVLYLANCNYYNPANGLISQMSKRITPAIMLSILVNKNKFPQLNVHHISHRMMLQKDKNELLQSDGSRLTYISDQSALYTMHDHKHSNKLGVPHINFSNTANRQLYGLSPELVPISVSITPNTLPSKPRIKTRPRQGPNPRLKPRPRRRLRSKPIPKPKSLKRPLIIRKRQLVKRSRKTKTRI